MENDKKNMNTDGGIKNTLVTIFSVLIYIAYRLVKGISGFIKGFPMSIKDIPGYGKQFKKSGICSIIFVIIIIVLAIVFWPVTISCSGALLVLAFITYGSLWK